MFRCSDCGAVMPLDDLPYLVHVLPKGGGAYRVTAPCLSCWDASLPIRERQRPRDLLTAGLEGLELAAAETRLLLATLGF